MISAFQKFHNLEPQTPVFRIESVNSKYIKICSKLINFLNEHNELTKKMTYAYQKLHNLEPQTHVFQIELFNSKRFKNLFKIHKFSD